MDRFRYELQFSMFQPCKVNDQGPGSTYIHIYIYYVFIYVNILRIYIILYIYITSHQSQFKMSNAFSSVFAPSPTLQVISQCVVN